MPFSQSEFQELLSGLRSEAVGSADEAPLLVFLESPIWGALASLSGVDIERMRQMASQKSDMYPHGRGVPHLTIDVGSSFRKAIDAHFGGRNLPENPLGTEWRLAHSHVLQIHGTTLRCAHRAWPDQFKVLGTFDSEQTQIFGAKAAALFQEAAVKMYGPEVMAAVQLAPIPASAAAQPRHANGLLDEVGLLEVSGNVIKLPTVQLLHYSAIKALLTKAGGRYHRNGFIFKSDEDARIALGAAGAKRDIRKETQFFRTRDDVIDLALSFFDYSELRGARFMEPSAGDGAIADKLRDHDVSEVVAIENWGPRAAELRAKGYQVLERDFLEVTPEDVGPISGIVMNPPFSNGQDVAHVSHALSFLDAQGKLSAIMPVSAGTHKTKRSQAFGRLLALLDDPVTMLPAGSFKDAGTNVATMNVRISMEELLNKLEKTGIEPSSLGLDLHRQMQRRGMNVASVPTPSPRRPRMRA